MIEIYKKLLLLGVKSSFMQNSPVFEWKDDVLWKLVESWEVSNDELSTYKRISNLISEIKEWGKNSIAIQSLEVKSNVKEIIESSDSIKVEWLVLVSNDWDYSVYSRNAWENWIILSNKEQEITDEWWMLWNLDFTWYTREEALHEVDDILTAVEEAQIFNTKKLEITEEKLKVAFRLKHAIYAKNDLV